MSTTKKPESHLVYGSKSANRMTLREHVALEMLKIICTSKGESDNRYLSDFAGEDAVHMADQLLRSLNGEEPKLGAVHVYWQKQY